MNAEVTILSAVLGALVAWFGTWFLLISFATSGQTFPRGIPVRCRLLDHRWVYIDRCFVHVCTRCGGVEGSTRDRVEYLGRELAA